ncbi:TPA: Lrp/AsnC family transcriptional regulator [Candidatus Woesearchaeota archaeon]|nr:Lrp/AsnC family transcriptional regulator [Candidatus Woesearchaeota archaeon]
MLDAKDKKILNLLQKDGRMLLKDISRKVGLSIDAVHNRMKKMQEAGVYYPSIFIDPKAIGYPLIIDVKVKLKDIDKKRYDQLIAYLKDYPNVIELFTVSGDYDLTLPIIAKDYDQLNSISLEIRNNFKDIIAEWRSGLNLKFFKFEEYDMERL